MEAEAVLITGIPLGLSRSLPAILLALQQEEDDQEDGCDAEDAAQRGADDRPDITTAPVLRRRVAAGRAALRRVIRLGG